MHEEEVIYKVVWNDGRHLLSYNTPRNIIKHGSYQDWIVEYREKKWVKPKVEDTKLFCFRRYIDAYQFSRHNCSGKIEVWEAKARGVCSVPPWLKEHFSSERDAYRTNWSGETPPGLFIGMPYGTILADEIMLVRRIE